MSLLSRRQARAALAGTAAAALYLAASRIGARRLGLTGLFIAASAAMAGAITAQSSSKAAITERRLNDMLNNGFSVGGDITVQGVTRAAGGITISGTTLTLNHGTVSVPGGAPGTYTATYDSAQSTAIADLQNKLSASNIL